MWTTAPQTRSSPAGPPSDHAQQPISAGTIATYLRAATRNPKRLLPALRRVEEFLAEKFSVGEPPPEESSVEGLTPESPAADGDR